jgi:hypothetical protein
MRTLALLLSILPTTIALAQEPPLADTAQPPADTAPPLPAQQQPPPAATEVPQKPINVAPQAKEAAPAYLPLAGYANGSFFLRDPHDWFVLFPKGRLQVDWYNFLNRGDVPAGVTPNTSHDPRPKDTNYLRSPAD